MKSIVNQKEEVKEKGFPKLMISGCGTVVLFTSNTYGSQVSNDDGFIGTYSSGWNMSAFKDFNGTVTLSND